MSLHIKKVLSCILQGHSLSWELLEFVLSHKINVCVSMCDMHMTRTWTQKFICIEFNSLLVIS